MQALKLFYFSNMYTKSGQRLPGPAAVLTSLDFIDIFSQTRVTVDLATSLSIAGTGVVCSAPRLD
jgi:hypothetical protein